jgi:sigma-54 dependent transcriptional regulator, acetoin dehydrogenase operon transcriptional activator AcoR
MMLHPHLFNSVEFLRKVFESIPYALMILDRNHRVRAVTSTLERVLSRSSDSDGVLDNCPGSLLRCIHAIGDHDGHATSETCTSCQAQALARSVLTENEPRSAKVPFQVSVNGRLVETELHLKGVPFQHDNERFVIIAVENVERLASLHASSRERGFHGIIGSDPAMIHLFDTIRRVGPTDSSALITGESGTGKELVALALHKESRRARELLVPVNCGALPEGVLDSELFGHVKGAFTGAVRDRKGRFELANRGTIFLDEVGELPLATQVKLLRVLQSGDLFRVGSEQPTHVDVRVICASNRCLEHEVEAGRFRADLYYRLSVIPIAVPPLRERTGDIPAIADHLLAVAAAGSGQRQATLSAEALEALLQHAWPGNIRELDNALRYGAIKAEGGVIEPKHLPPTVFLAPTPRLLPRETGRQRLSTERVVEVLRSTRGNRAKAARLLGVSRATFYRFLADNTENNSG